MVPFPYIVIRQVYGQGASRPTIDKEFQVAAVCSAILEVVASIALGNDRLVCRRHGVWFYPSFQCDAFGAVCIQLLLRRHENWRLGSQCAVASFGKCSIHIRDFCITQNTCFRILYLMESCILREASSDRLILPVPNEAALHIFIVADFFPILVKATKRVTHGVCVLGPDIRDLIVAILSITGRATLCRVLYAINVYQTLFTIIRVHRIFRVNAIAVIITFVFSHTAWIAL